MIRPGAPPSAREGSSLRVVTGVALLVSALGVAVYGFTTLFGVLDAGGYGTPAMTMALLILGLGGAFFAGGTATLIWEIAKRYERP
ncbi:MAG: hypothetical protein ACT4QD_22555 [Acidobacteriota bacterium]